LRARARALQCFDEALVDLRGRQTSRSTPPVAAALRAEHDSLVTSQIVVAEPDYLILQRLGMTWS
jgi:hypothetical protein